MPSFSRFGTVPESPPDARDYEIRPFLARPKASATGLPDEVGVINAEIHRAGVGIRDQGQEGSCTGHGLRNVKAVIEQRQRPRWQRKRVPDFGPRGIYNLAKQVGGYPDEEGAYMRDVVKAAETYGVPREKDWPYVAGHRGQPKTPRWLQYARPWGIGAYARVRNHDEMLLTLHEVGPVFIAMNLTSSFDEVDDRGYVPANPTGEEWGGHAMAVLAANQSERRYLLANSWGPGWGADGYCWVDVDHFWVSTPHEAWAVPDMTR